MMTPRVASEAQDAAPGPKHEVDVLDMGFLLRQYWKRKFFLLACVAAGIVVGIFNLARHEPVHTASMTIAPNKESLKDSEALLDRLISKLSSFELEERLLQEDGQWQELIESLPEGQDETTSTQVLVKRSLSTFTVSGMRRLGQTVITLRAPGERFVTELLRMAFEGADQFIREEDRRDAAKTVERIQERLTTTNLPESAAALRKMLMDAEAQAIRTHSDLTYAAHVACPPFTIAGSHEPAMEREVVAPVLVCLGVGLLGITLLAILRERE